MTGIKEFNYPAFHEAAAQLRKEGYTVISPAESFGGRKDLPYEVYMEHDLVLVELADAIATIDGFQKSSGATREVNRARELRKEVKPVNAWIAEAKSIRRQRKTERPEFDGYPMEVRHESFIKRMPETCHALRKHAYECGQVIAEKCALTVSDNEHINSSTEDMVNRIRRDITEPFRREHLSLIEETLRLKAEIDEYEQLFDLLTRRMERATALWRKAHPSESDTIPDLGRLVDWLISSGDF